MFGNILHYIALARVVEKLTHEATDTCTTEISRAAPGSNDEVSTFLCYLVDFFRADILAIVSKERRETVAFFVALLCQAR